MPFCGRQNKLAFLGDILDLGTTNGNWEKWSYLNWQFKEGFCGSAAKEVFPTVLIGTVECTSGARGIAKR